MIDCFRSSITIEQKRSRYARCGRNCLVVARCRKQNHGNGKFDALTWLSQLKKVKRRKFWSSEVISPHATWENEVGLYTGSSYSLAITVCSFRSDEWKRFYDSQPRHPKGPPLFTSIAYQICTLPSQYPRPDPNIWFRPNYPHGTIWQTPRLLSLTCQNRTVNTKQGFNRISRETATAGWTVPHYPLDKRSSGGRKRFPHGTVLGDFGDTQPSKLPKGLNHPTREWSQCGVYETLVELLLARKKVTMPWHCEDGHTYACHATFLFGSPLNTQKSRPNANITGICQILVFGKWKAFSIYLISALTLCT